MWLLVLHSSQIPVLKGSTLDEFTSTIKLIRLVETACILIDGMLFCDVNYDSVNLIT